MAGPDLGSYPREDGTGFGGRREPPPSAPTVSMQQTEVVYDLGRLTGRKFGTVYADPPWSYSNQSTRAAAQGEYPGMSVDALSALPISALVADDAHLHLWTTNAFLFDAKKILEAWGFEYRSCFVWVKPRMGLGNYWRVSHEFLVFGLRGRGGFADKGLMSWAEIDRPEEHSRKPERVREMIERASPGPRLELFGRRVAEGWTVWGNDITDAVYGPYLKEVSI